MAIDKSGPKLGTGQNNIKERWLGIKQHKKTTNSNTKTNKQRPPKSTTKVHNKTIQYNDHRQTRLINVKR